MKPFSLYIRLCLLCLGTATFTSCNLFPKEEPIDCPSQTEYYYLDAEAKAQIPYKGYDTIRMVSNTGDTFNFIGTIKKPFTTQSFELYGNPACGNNGTTKVYEAYKLLFEDSVRNKTISVEQLKEGSELRIEHNKSLYIFSYYDISNKLFKDIITHDSLIINSKIYFLVSEFPSVKDSSSRLFINKKNGILKIITNNNTETLEKL